MIITRTWLEEYIDLDGIDNAMLYATFNAIGLEVERLTEYVLPEKVVVGKMVACDRHPDADKLSLCQIDIGEEAPRQIICGAANVREAEYVAVAMLGAVLPDGMTIAPVTLRGVESFGMVCSAEELGLPKGGEGILILDESLGVLNPGQPLNTYPQIADTVIELELTANRGDCLSIRGVARDLSAALDRSLKTPEKHLIEANGIGIARTLEIRSQKELPVDLHYLLAECDSQHRAALVGLRMAFIEAETVSHLESLLQYATHETGVVLRAFDGDKLDNGNGKIVLSAVKNKQGIVQILHNDDLVSSTGLSQESAYVATDASKTIVIEASYIDPGLIVQTVGDHKVKTDPLYYRTSRGSEPELSLGAIGFQRTCSLKNSCRFYDGNLAIRAQRDERIISTSINALSAIIGNPVTKTSVFAILKRLGMTIRDSGNETFGIRIPAHAHDIHNDQDIAEEILRIMGIDNIESHALLMIEHNRFNAALQGYQQKRSLRERAVAIGFFEAITYAFANRSRLEKYGFETIDVHQELINPIAEELNTLRTTLLVNLLDALKRNINYGMKRIALFEVGAVFDARRQQHDRVAFAWSGQGAHDGVSNQGKPASIGADDFVARIEQVMGDITLKQDTAPFGLAHPYLTARMLQGEQEIGWLFKLHPSVAETYGLPDTWMAELEMEAWHTSTILAHPVSNFQGVYKDLSVVVDAQLPYRTLDQAIASSPPPLLRRWYPVDVYRDAALAEGKSVTIRLLVQSEKGTLSDKEIDATVSAVLERLEVQCQAHLR